MQIYDHYIVVDFYIHIVIYLWASILIDKYK